MELGGILLAMTFFQLLDLDDRIPSSTACNKERQTQNSDRNHICNSTWNNHKKRLKWPLQSSCINQFVGLFRAGDQVLVLMQRMIMYVSMKPKNLIEWAGPEASQILGGPWVGCGFCQALPIPYRRWSNQTWWEFQGSRGGTVELAGKADSVLLCWFCHPLVNQQKWPVMPFQAYWTWLNEEPLHHSIGIRIYECFLTGHLGSLSIKLLLVWPVPLDEVWTLNNFSFDFVGFLLNFQWQILLKIQ